jgi:hypothetical protein
MGRHARERGAEPVETRAAGAVVHWPRGMLAEIAPLDSADDVSERGLGGIGKTDAPQDLAAGQRRGKGCAAAAPDLGEAVQQQRMHRLGEATLLRQLVRRDRHCLGRRGAARPGFGVLLPDAARPQHQARQHFSDEKIEQHHGRQNHGAPKQLARQRDVPVPGARLGLMRQIELQVETADRVLGHLPDLLLRLRRGMAHATRDQRKGRERTRTPEGARDG